MLNDFLPRRASSPDSRRAAALPLALLLLASCRHLSGADVAPLPHEAPPAPVDRAPHASASAPPAAEPGSPSATSTPAPEGSAQPNDESSAQPDDEHFDDLFDRMRAGFSLPQVDDVAVDRRLQWYVQHPAYLDRAFRRGRRYLPHIVGELERRGMPRELALLPVLESAFDPFAYSPSHAAGLWQIIPSTGRLFGLRRSWWWEGRRDVIEATRAALDYLQRLHREFDGDWLLAVAAYNTGAVNVHRAVERNRRRGRPTDFFHLDLPLETRSYVPKFLALARLVREPGAYGLELPAIPNEPYFARVRIDDPVDLGVLADLAGTPRKELIALNPGFNRWATAPDGPHRLLVPASAEALFAKVLAELPPARRLRSLHHRVAPGETLIALAARYRISVDALRLANRIRGSLIRAGQDLLIPLSYRAVAAARHAAPLGAEAIARTSAPQGSGATYTVRRGDTLAAVSRRFRVSIPDLVAWNELADPDRLAPGQRLVIVGNDSVDP